MVDPHNLLCEFTLAADRFAPGTARKLIGGWLTAARWPAEELDAIVYAVSEAVSNAAEHAYPPGATGHIDVTAQIEDARRNGAGPVQQVRVSVRDHGRWRIAPATDEGRRRGLVVIAELMYDLSVLPGPDPPTATEATGTEIAMISTAVTAVR